MISIISRSVDETLAIGEVLGKLVMPGDFIALTGDLGSGKTHFAQGIARGLGVGPGVCITSPSYTLLNEYSNGRIPLFHFDLYRLDGDMDIRGLGFDEYFTGSGVCVVEWADRMHEELPDDYLNVVFDVTGDTERNIAFHWKGTRHEELALEMAKYLKTGSDPRGLVKRCSDAGWDPNFFRIISSE